MWHGSWLQLISMSLVILGRRNKKWAVLGPGLCRSLVGRFAHSARFPPQTSPQRIELFADEFQIGHRQALDFIPYLIEDGANPLFILIEIGFAHLRLANDLQEFINV